MQNYAECDTYSPPKILVHKNLYRYVFLSGFSSMYCVNSYSYDARCSHNESIYKVKEWERKKIAPRGEERNDEEK